MKTDVPARVLERRAFVRNYLEKRFPEAQISESWAGADQELYFRITRPGKPLLGLRIAKAVLTETTSTPEWIRARLTLWEHEVEPGFRIGPAAIGFFRPG